MGERIAFHHSGAYTYCQTEAEFQALGPEWARLPSGPFPAIAEKQPVRNPPMNPVEAARLNPHPDDVPPFRSRKKKGKICE